MNLKQITTQFIQQHLKLQPKDSHKSQNGKLTIIGGSKLFHGASLWALKIASRIVDMVYYISVPQNQVLTEYLKKNLYSFISVPRGKEEEYMAESDGILIGPGMVRGSSLYTGTGESGKQTKQTTLKYFKKFSNKQWIIDAGALQAITTKDLQQLNHPIITPHQGEFQKLFPDISSQQAFVSPTKNSDSTRCQAKLVQQAAQKIGGPIVLKGPADIIASPDQVIINQAGNEGMTKGGTGDVLAGLIAALACTHNPFTAAAIGSYLNGQAGDHLYKTVGPYLSADDLCNQVPKTLWENIQ